MALMTYLNAVGLLMVVGVWAVCLYQSGIWAYDIRLYAINTYGRVIHEFDPWFNYRATEYLGAQVAEHGWWNGHVEFFHWYDYKSWYPLGRPVGTTIYPGMQMSSVLIHRIINALGVEMSLNDVCCFVPVWFGVSGTFFLAFLTSECSQSWSTGAAAAAIMSVVPAHLMRCHGGGYDNESVAITAMCMTFFLWVRALRADPKLTNGEPTRDSYIFGVLAGLAYIYMVAAWGGYIFVVNMIAIHAAALGCMGRYSSKLHRAYSLFYVIGVAGAMQVPVVGWTPLKSLEQMSGMAVFVIFQMLEICEHSRRKNNLSWAKTQVLRVQASYSRTPPRLPCLARLKSLQRSDAWLLASVAAGDHCCDVITRCHHAVSPFCSLAGPGRRHDGGRRDTGVALADRLLRPVLGPHPGTFRQAHPDR